MSFNMQDDPRKVARIVYTVVKQLVVAQSAAHLLRCGTRGPYGYRCPFSQCVRQMIAHEAKLLVAKPTGTRGPG